MRRCTGALLALVAMASAMPAAGQTGPSSRPLMLGQGGLICFSDSMLVHETPAEFERRRRNEASLPDWIYDAIDRMQSVPDRLSFEFRQAGHDRVLIANGEIDDTAASRLAEALRQYGPIHEVWFNSPGGISEQGVQLGELIRRHGSGTRVRSGDGCASACSTAFLGGVMRKVEPGAVYGVHVYSRPLDVSGPSSQDEQNAMVQREVREATERSFYVSRMGVGKLWLDLWSGTNPGCMTFMSQHEMRDAFVNNID